MQLRNPSKNLKGIDVSHWQNFIDWKAASGDGVKFAYVKLTDGDNYIDNKSDENIVGAKSEGIKVGAYHFARFVDVASAQKEAQWFIDHVKDYDLDLPHVLDIEINHAKLSKADLSKAILAWLEMVKEYGDVMIYTGDSFEHSLLDETLKDYKIWIAHYGVDKPADSPIWDKWTAFQYSQTGSVKGINGHVDMDEAEPGFFENVVKVQPKPETPKPKESIVKKVVKAVEHIIHHDTHYSVAPNDTLSGIAAKFNVSVNDLVKWNNIKDKDIIRIGQMITIKKANQHVAPSHASKKTYIVKSGDSLSKIASDNKMSLAEIEKLNPQIKDFDILSIGEKINLN